jgi:hypothetical protein
VSSLMDLYNARRRPAGREQGDEQDLDEEDFGDHEEAAEQYRLEREEREKTRADARARAQVPQGGLWPQCSLGSQPCSLVIGVTCCQHLVQTVLTSGTIEMSIGAGASCLMMTALPMLVFIVYCITFHCLCQEKDMAAGLCLPMRITCRSQRSLSGQHTACSMTAAVCARCR